MVLQTKGSLLTCRCFSNAQVSFFAQRFALENHPTCFLAKLALRRTPGAWSEPRLLEAPKHLLWIDDESRHAESALEDAFKAFSSLGVNQLINVSGTFNWPVAQGLRKRRCFFFATENLEEIHMALWCFICTDEAVCNRTA